ncbi:MAG: rhamnogalacturonan lyase [Verrucomicrobiota bacterium]
MRLRTGIAAFVAGVLFLSTSHASAQRQMERLGRGVVALHQGEGKIFIGWRLLGTDPERVSFNVYRATGEDAPVKLNGHPITNATHFIDVAAKLDHATTYSVRPLADGVEQGASGRFMLSANPPARPYLSIPLQTPAGYTPNDGSVGDLDGDGEYEIVLHQVGRGRDNSQAGLTTEPILQAYKFDGTLLWTINLGKNIREGAHYTQFMVYDLDGDGRAELACKTADGAMDGKGKVIGDAKADYRNAEGRILTGPEFFTLFDGLTGAALATVDYLPPRGDIGAWGGVGGNGGNDRIGNRADRFLACIAYLDGIRPSVVMCRGYYGRSVLAAWDWRDGRLTSRWVFDTDKGYPAYAGQGAHCVSVADVDDDGRDEIVYGAMCVDDDGKGLWTTGLRHGDALHVGDLDPSRPGLEIWNLHEIEGRTKGPGTDFRDARTGKIHWTGAPDIDVSRGLAADIDPRHFGAEMWGGPEGLRNCQGERLGRGPRSANFAIWWDGDLLRELLDRTSIYKWDWQNAAQTTLFTAEGCASNNGSKATPVLSADLLGDWREEVIWRAADNQELRIYTTTIPTAHRLRTLMHDPQYRLSVAWQNVGYNQPPHPGFFLGDGMKAPPRPPITTK